MSAAEFHDRRCVTPNEANALKNPLCVLIFLLGGLLVACTVASDNFSEQNRRNFSERTRKVHFSSIVVDTHDDTTQRFLDPKFDFGVRHSDGSIDIPRMRAGGL